MIVPLFRTMQRGVTLRVAAQCGADPRFAQRQNFGSAEAFQSRLGMPRQHRLARLREAARGPAYLRRSPLLCAKMCPARRITEAGLRFCQDLPIHRLGGLGSIESDAVPGAARSCALPGPALRVRAKRRGGISVLPRSPDPGSGFLGSVDTLLCVVSLRCALLGAAECRVAPRGFAQRRDFGPVERLRVLSEVFDSAGLPMLPALPCVSASGKAASCSAVLRAAQRQNFGSAEALRSEVGALRQHRMGCCARRGVGWSHSRRCWAAQGAEAELRSAGCPRTIGAIRQRGRLAVSGHMGCPEQNPGCVR